LIAFANWCSSKNVKRLTGNPFEDLPRADEKADPRRRRRSMTETELARLLDVARRRPLIDALAVWVGKRRGEHYANVRPEVRERLEALGRERALIYKTLVLTGLRKGELASLTVGQLRLDGPTPHIELDAADEKNREGNAVPIRADLADDLRAWLGERLGKLQDAARLRLPVSIPSCLPADTPLFTVPTALVRILNHDLKAAGIPKRDDRGRTLDVHALRHNADSRMMPTGVRKVRRDPANRANSSRPEAA
jgi:integrase